ncbi:MAG: ATP-binding cassette domain-containing protein, partial [Trueperaceae bacterium]
EANLPSWQKNLGYVPQQIYLTDDTVAANIALGIPQQRVDMEAVERAARMANVHDFIVEEMPEGYDTIVGERGVRLSGGQRQRVGIARALYHDPAVLVFDEATSALDGLTEESIFRAVSHLGKTKTIIMIAHRMSTVRACDLIYMLDHGRIVARGSFDQLMEQNASFRAMALAGSVGNDEREQAGVR